MFTFLFSPNGRINRYQYWLHFYLPYAGILIAASIADFAVMGLPEPGQPAIGPFYTIVALFYLWPSIAVTVKRLHDRGMTGWWVLFPMIPILIGAALIFIMAQGTEVKDLTPQQWGPGALVVAIGFVLNIYSLINVWFLPSQPGENQYGSEPPKL